MLIMLYRWHIDPAKESQFIEGWSEVTEYYRQNWDSLGSRLHRGSDGLFYGYAQWKSVEDREKAFSNSPELKGTAKMTDAILERLEPISLEKLSDFLIFAEK